MNQRFNPNVFNTRRKKTRGARILLAVFQVIGVVIAVGVLMFFLLSEHQDAGLPTEEGSKILKWAKMNAPPEGSSNFALSMPDENNSKMFIFSFQPPSETAFRRWQIQSPGTENLKPSLESLGVQLYTIVPKLPTDRYVEIRYYQETNTVTVSASPVPKGEL